MRVRVLVMGSAHRVMAVAGEDMKGSRVKHGVVSEPSEASAVKQLRAPLDAVAHDTEAIAHRCRDASPALAREIEHLVDDVALLQRSLDDAIDLASLDAGTLVLHREMTDLRSLLAEVIGSSLAPHLRPRLRLCCGPVGRASVDRARLGRIVVSFICNAFARSRHDAQVDVRLDERDQLARISVIDSGPALTSAQIRQVFHRRGKEAAVPVPGERQGLHVACRIIERHGGRVGCESLPTIGTTLSIELPIGAATTGRLRTFKHL